MAQLLVVSVFETSFEQSRDAFLWKDGARPFVRKGSLWRGPGMQFGSW